MRRKNYVFTNNSITPLGSMILKWGSKQNNNRKEIDKNYGKENTENHRNTKV